MAAGRALVELMPHMRALDAQLCRRGAAGSVWGATPMYAYGGLSLVAGVRHACLLGRPAPGGGAGAPAFASEALAVLFHEVGRWHSSQIWVDLGLLRSTLAEAFRILDGDHAGGRVCPLPHEDRLLCA